MEQLNIIFKDKTSDVDLRFYKAIFASNHKSHIYSPVFEDNRLFYYSTFEELFNKEVELFITTYTNFLDFFAELKPNFSTYLDIFKDSDETTFLIAPFFEGLRLDAISVKEKLKILFHKTNEFAINYKFDKFYCKLYEDDKENYFSHKGFGCLYDTLSEDSLDII